MIEEIPPRIFIIFVVSTFLVSTTVIVYNFIVQSNFVYKHRKALETANYIIEKFGENGIINSSLISDIGANYEIIDLETNSSYSFGEKTQTGISLPCLIFNNGIRLCKVIVYE